MSPRAALQLQMQYGPAMMGKLEAASGSTCLSGLGGDPQQGASRWYGGGEAGNRREDGEGRRASGEGDGRAGCHALGGVGGRERPSPRSASAPRSVSARNAGAAGAGGAGRGAGGAGGARGERRVTPPVHAGGAEVEGGGWGDEVVCSGGGGGSGGSSVSMGGRGGTRLPSAGRRTGQGADGDSARWECERSLNYSIYLLC
jgi:hypothetical protein